VRPDHRQPAACHPQHLRDGSSLQRCAAAASPQVVEYQWTGTDEFDGLDDRVDAAPLPLPKLTASKRVILVRHGQSTWNADGRIQGKSAWHKR
jgi:hypothetical protein